VQRFRSFMKWVIRGCTTVDQDGLKSPKALRGPTIRTQDEVVLSAFYEIIPILMLFKFPEAVPEFAHIHEL